MKGRKDPRVGEIFGWFRKAWQGKYRGSSWAPEAGVASNVTSMLAGLDQLDDGGVEFQRLPAAIARYMLDERKHLNEAKHPLRLFCQDANRYRAETVAPAASAGGYVRL